MNIKSALRKLSFAKPLVDDSDDSDVSPISLLHIDFTEVALKASPFIKNQKISKAVVWGGLAYSIIKPIYIRWLDNRNSSDQYRIVISENDYLYDFIKELVAVIVPKESQHSLAVYSHADNEMSFRTRRESPKKDSEYTNLVAQYNSRNTSEVVLGGVKCHVLEIQNEVDHTQKIKFASPNEFHIMVSSAAERDQVLAWFDQLLEKKSTPDPRYYRAMSWGSFNFQSDVPLRSKDSVILKEGQMDRIIGNLRTFLNSEKQHTELGIPYHTGILLYGAPGTGKTSLAIALANELGLNIYFIPLSNVDNDSSLMDLFADIPSRSVLLLEDVDVVRAATSRDDSEKGITLGGLLNAIDGVGSPHGLITIMTTNHMDSLDPALIRAGRVDMREHISEIDQYQLTMLCKAYLGYVPENLPNVDECDKLVAADVMEVFKKNLLTPENVEDALFTFFEEKAKEKITSNYK